MTTGTPYRLISTGDTQRWSPKEDHNSNLVEAHAERESVRVTAFKTGNTKVISWSRTLEPVPYQTVNFIMEYAL